MIGSGVVDPGMVDTDTASEDTSSASQSQMQTEISSSSTDTTTTDQGGAYLENTSPNFQQEGFSEPTPIQSAPLAEAMTVESQSFEQADMAPSGDYVVEADAWKEPDWVTSNADGSVTVQPPAGVSIDSGIANFPMTVANDALPIPEEITLQADGSADIALPEGTQFNVETGQLTLPAGEAQPQDVPEAFMPVVNPDGSLTVTLPQGLAQYDAEANTLNLANSVVNDIAPSYMEVNLDGSVDITLPEDTHYNPDGSFTIPADSMHHMDSPPPEYVQEVEFANYQPDGSVQFELPQGATVDGGVAEFPYNVAVENLPIPEDTTLNADGTINKDLPEGATYLPEYNAINLPAESFNPTEIPDGMHCYNNPDGSFTVPLPDGMNYDAASNSVHMSNYWVNEFAPEPVHISPDGAIQVELPPGTEFQSAGAFVVPHEHVDFISQPAPDYVHDVAYAEPLGDGSYVVNPPAGVEVQETPAGMQMQFPYEAVAENVPVPHDAEILPDGGVKLSVPEGTQYESEFNRLTLPESTVALAEIPEGVAAHANPDGTISVTLPEGINYNPADGSITMNNYWANEFAPPSVEISPMGDVNVTLPPTIDYQPDGSFVVPSENADFLAEPDPAYTVGAPDWVAPQPDGSVMFTPPAGIPIDATQGTMTMSFEQVEQNFTAQMPTDMVVHTDGSMEMPVPQGTTYDAAAKMLTLPAGELYSQDIPSGIAYTMMDSGAIAVTLPPGIEFDPAENTVTFNNYWANEVAPPAVTIMPDGQLQVDLPPQTQYFENGAFSVSPAYVDFIDNPAPPYVYDGPEWVNMSSDGAVHFQPPTEFQIDPQAGTVTLPMEAMDVHFENHTPDDMQFNPDGTVNITMPSYVSYDAASGVVTIPADYAAEHMPPPQVMPYFNESGDLCVKLPPGIEFDIQTNSVHLDNYWTNELAPPNIEIHADGYMQVQMPAGTYYHDGGMSVPPDQANFMEEPQPPYVAEGPDYMQCNPDGSFSIQPPANMTLDAEAGTVTMSMDTFRAELHMDDGDMRFNGDGTADVKLPEGTQFNVATGNLQFPAGSTQMHEIPPQLSPMIQPDGSIEVRLPEGISYNAADSSVHLNNQWLNELVPQPVTFNTDGTVAVHLPEDTQYFENGSFVVSAESSGFMDGDQHQQVDSAPQYTGTYPYPEYQAQYPQYQPTSGTYSAPTGTAA
jgi:hypothetical protein